MANNQVSDEVNSPIGEGDEGFYASLELGLSRARLVSPVAYCIYVCECQCCPRCWLGVVAVESSFS
jgi:hypothetical protein